LGSGSIGAPWYHREQFVGRVQLTPALGASFLHAMRVAFVVFAALCVAGVFASLARGNLRREAAATSTGRDGR
jgi:hypothetical protein